MLSKIDVMRQACFSGSGEEGRQVSAFGLSRASTVQDDQSCCGALSGKFQEVAAIAGDHNGSRFDGVLPDGRIGCCRARNMEYFLNLVPGITKEADYLNRNVFVDEEFHSSRCCV